MNGNQSSTNRTYTSTNVHVALVFPLLPLRATSLVSAQKESLSSCLVKLRDIKCLNWELIFSHLWLFPHLSSKVPINRPKRQVRCLILPSLWLLFSTSNICSMINHV
jgi:hypothetical protein